MQAVAKSILRVATFTLVAIGITSGAWSQSAATEGEIREVDKATAKMTIRHGPVPAFDMQGMTMVFRVAEPEVLERFKPGDRINFTVTKNGGAFYATEIKPAE